MTEEIIGINEKVKQKSIIEIGKESIDTGTLTFEGEETIECEIPFNEKFDNQKLSLFPKLKLTTTENDVITLYFTNDNIYVDVNNRRKFKKLLYINNSLYEDEILVGVHMEFDFESSSNFKLENNEEKSWAGIHILTNYGDVLSMIINEDNVEITNNRIKKDYTLGKFILSELVYNHSVFFDENDKDTFY